MFDQRDAAAITVLHILHRLDHGGIEHWLLNLLAITDPAQLAVDILVHGQPGSLEPLATARGARIIRGESPHRPLAFARRLRQILNHEGPYRVVHSHLFRYSGLVLRIAASAGVPIRIAHSHTAVTDASSWKRAWYRRVMTYLIRRHSTHGLACSRAALENLFGPETDPRWSVLPNGINTDRYVRPIDRRALRRELGIAADALVIGHVGRLIRSKNHARLLRIAAAMPEATLLLIGDGPMRDELQAQALALGLSERCRFLGSRTDVPDLLALMDVFLFPSVEEGFGLAIVEAQARGLPVVLSNTIPEEAIVVPDMCRRVQLDAPLETWIDAVRSASTSPRMDGASAVAASPYHHQASYEALMEIYSA